MTSPPHTLKTFQGIVDSTLREGEQTPGVHFSPDQRLEIVARLARVGIDEIELGIASARNPHLPEFIGQVRERIGQQSRLALWCRCRREDIDFAVACAPDVLSLSIPASDLHIEERLQKDRAWILRTLEESITRALEAGIPLVSVGLEDATRADRPFLYQLVQTAEQSGASRIRLADTVGICSPAEIADLVRRIGKRTTLALGVHTHNDFGMATANSIAAQEAGAAWIDATVLGLGERAGNCRLEETVGFLCLKKGLKRYHTAELRPLCLLVSNVAGTTITPGHPVVGEDIFTCETGLHLHGLTSNPATYEPYDPNMVGARRNLRFGHKVGRRALLNHLQALGYPVDDNEIEKLLHRLRSSAGSKTLSDEELILLLE
ncbi:homocitrate synthase [Desulfolithobacter dissulfuricans]|uniref:Homocitrate synthase n=1 Tax=Desulfolithobacter dissulfuricans TaxID=2795293 RepID=A0A915XK71_9BACT|nr:pyruvate carboxyltransferase [Desulfolithobacter dissulfuricans]BCO07871.1 homocitrate synthase [Desulfolithobacter dissulfuricans]